MSAEMNESDRVQAILMSEGIREFTECHRQLFTQHQMFQSSEVSETS